MIWIKSLVLKQGSDHYLLENPSAELCELVDAAVFVACRYGSRTWIEELPFPGVDISYVTSEK